MSNKLRAYPILHFCVLIWGFTAILGKKISLEALPLVWWRVVLCCVSLLLLIPLKYLEGISRKNYTQMTAVGALVGIHWVLFYGAIKLSNASVAVATMATTAFFAALAEPLLLRQKVKWYELVLGILILPGMSLIVGNITWGQKVGFAVGILGALLAAVFSALNKKIVDSPQAPHPLAMSLTELGGGALVCCALLPAWLCFFPETTLMPEHLDWLWLLLLAWVCTLLPFSLNLIAMRHISAFGANLTINLEPVYGVTLAAIFFQEHQELNPWFYLGVGIILIAVFSHPFIKMNFERKS